MSIEHIKYNDMHITNDYNYAIMSISFDLKVKISQLSPETREQSEIKGRDYNDEIYKYSRGRQEQLIETHNNVYVPPLMFMGRVLGRSITP